MGAAGAVAGIVTGGLIGGVGTAYAGKKAAEAQEEGAYYQLLGTREAIASQEKIAAQSLALQREQLAEAKIAFQQGREDIAPWRAAGERGLAGAIEMIEAGPGEFEADPGYQFRVAEGEKALERHLASRGMLRSGAAGRAYTELGQQLGSQEYSSFMNRYYQKLNPQLALAGMGQVSAGQQAALGGQLGGLGVQAGAQQAQTLGLLSGQIGQQAAIGGQAQYLAGQARATGYTNVANALTGGMQSTINNLLLYSALG